MRLSCATARCAVGLLRLVRSCQDSQVVHWGLVWPHMHCDMQDRHAHVAVSAQCVVSFVSCAGACIVKLAVCCVLCAVLCCVFRAMIKSATEAGAIPTFHYMDEIEVDGLLAARSLLKHDDTLQGERANLECLNTCRPKCASFFLLQYRLRSQAAQCTAAYCTDKSHQHTLLRFGGSCPSCCPTSPIVLLASAALRRLLPPFLLLLPSALFLQALRHACCSYSKALRISLGRFSELNTCCN